MFKKPDSNCPVLSFLQNSNPPGVRIRPPHFGTTEAIEGVELPWLAETISYFILLILRFTVSEAMYRKNYDIVGAAYDFRKAPSTCVCCLCVRRTDMDIRRDRQLLSRDFLTFETVF